MAHENEIEDMSLGTLATIEDFPNRNDWQRYRAAIISLDVLFDWQTGPLPHPATPPGRIRATIGWYENLPEKTIPKQIRDQVPVIEDFISRKYQGRY